LNTQNDKEGGNTVKEPFVSFIETELGSRGDEGWELVTAAVEES